MVRNTLGDLQNLLFERLEALNDAEGEQEIEREIAKANASAKLATVIVNNSNTILNCAVMRQKVGAEQTQRMLGA